MYLGPLRRKWNSKVKLDQTHNIKWSYNNNNNNPYRKKCHYYIPVLSQGVNPFNHYFYSFSSFQCWAWLFIKYENNFNYDEMTKPNGKKTENVGAIDTRGRFHQTLCAKRKDAGAQRPAKNLPINFINIIKCQICRLKFAKFVRRSPNAIRHKRRQILWANFLPKAVRRRIFAWRKCWWNRP